MSLDEVEVVDDVTSDLLVVSGIGNENVGGEGRGICSSRALTACVRESQAPAPVGAFVALEHMDRAALERLMGESGLALGWLHEPSVEIVLLHPLESGLDVSQLPRSDLAALALPMNALGPAASSQLPAVLNREATLALASCAVAAFSFDGLRAFAELAGMPRLNIHEASPLARPYAVHALPELYRRGVLGAAAAACMVGCGSAVIDFRRRRGYSVESFVADGNVGNAAASAAWRALWLVYREDWASHAPLEDPELSAAVRAWHQVANSLLRLPRDQYQIRWTPVDVPGLR